MGTRGARREEKLTAQQRLFVREYLDDRNGTQAAIRAGYSERTAGSQAHDLLKKPEIRRLVNEGLERLEKRLTEKTEVRLERILLELHRIFTVDPLDLWTDGLTLKPLAEIEPDVRRAIASMKVTELFEGQGENRKLVGYLRDVKFNPKTEATQQLLRVLGAFKDKLEVTERPYHELVAEAARRLREQRAGGGR